MNNEIELSAWKPMTLAIPAPAEPAISFHFKGETILSLNETGMTYRGVRIDDAGQAHSAFLETMKVLNSHVAPTPLASRSRIEATSKSSLIVSR